MQRKEPDVYNLWVKAEKKKDWTAMAHQGAKPKTNKASNRVNRNCINM